MFWLVSVLLLPFHLSLPRSLTPLPGNPNFCHFLKTQTSGSDRPLTFNRILQTPNIQQKIESSYLTGRRDMENSFNLLYVSLHLHAPKTAFFFFPSQKKQVFNLRQVTSTPKKSPTSLLLLFFPFLLPKQK